MRNCTSVKRILLRKQANQVRLEGKAYEVQDGDVIEIRFSV